ncbi:zinc-ribbon domain-containing protein [Candidatus Bathyarchaeota archaeon]|nr:zinc-ribbon domain-containing protein [Candidatus Bathyarchaeota archaeon]
MPYCRRCGTQLEESARFCHRCGTPVDPNVQPQVQPAQTYPPYPAYQQTPPPSTEAKQPRPLHKEPLIIAAIALTVVLIAALIISAFMIAPVSPWSTSETLSDQTAGVDTLNLNFDINVGDVDVVPLQIGDRNILITVVANGSRSSPGGGSSGPLTLTFDNQTNGGTLTVNSQIRIEDAYTSGANVGVTIYVDPALKLNLNISSAAGDVTFSADRNVVIESLNLQTTTGDVSANLGNATLTGDVVLASSALGNVNYRMSQNALEGNCTIQAKVTTGNANLDITETKALQGNLQVYSEAVTGNINLRLKIDGSVAAQIESQAPALGKVNTELNNFSGEKTLLQSHNYPSQANIEVSNTISGLGNVNIQADYITTIIYN